MEALNRVKLEVSAIEALARIGGNEEELHKAFTNLRFEIECVQKERRMVGLQCRTGRSGKGALLVERATQTARREEN